MTEKYYGKLLEPRGTQILHGAGQSDDEFANYRTAVLPHRPLLYMTYCGLKRLSAEFFTILGNKLEQYAPDYLIPQIGLGMTHDGTPEEHYEHLVAEGQYDEQLEIFCRGLKALNRPALLRIGFEFSGQWNGYQAESYIAAWKRVVDALRAHELNEVATAWCYAPDSDNKDFMSYYPGDDYVDWWSIDTFSPEHFTAADSIAFMQESRQRGFPVLIGESTPRFVGVQDGTASWEQWFAKYFAFMREYPNVKAFSYISWDWASYPMWADWGNGRITDNAEVLAHYRRELADSRYLHADGEAEVRGMLGV